jgi:PBP1b-binding outer membrane lipoprotein LpoB
MIRKLIAVVALVGVLGMTGCASVPMAPKAMDAQAKQFQPAPDKAKVYIYRNEVMGSAIKMPVLIDNVEVGDTVSKTYIEKDLAPGPHTITSKSEKDSSLTIDMLAGKVYYVWQEIKMGMFAAR